MTHQEATAVLAVPLSQVETKLKDVSSWTAFLAGVTDIRRVAFQRYTFLVVAAGGGHREVDAAVIEHPKEHRFSWRSLAGPRFDGELRLAEVDAGHTRVHLSLIAEPTGFLAGLTEMLGSSHSTATVDVQRLEAFVTGTVAA